MQFKTRSNKIYRGYEKLKHSDENSCWFRHDFKIFNKSTTISFVESIKITKN